MLPRNKIGNKISNILFLPAVLAIFIFFASNVMAGDNPIIDFYQEHISAVDGNRCPMYPSCSAYCKHAFEKHGVVVGWVMSLDRLVRCGRDEAKTAPQVKINEHRLIYDPLEANDFWWSKKEAKK